MISSKNTGAYSTREIFLQLKSMTPYIGVFIFLKQSIIVETDYFYRTVVSQSDYRNGACAETDRYRRRG